MTDSQRIVEDILKKVSPCPKHKGRMTFVCFDKRPFGHVALFICNNNKCDWVVSMKVEGE